MWGMHGRLTRLYDRNKMIDDGGTVQPGDCTPPPPLLPPHLVQHEAAARHAQPDARHPACDTRQGQGQGQAARKRGPVKSPTVWYHQNHVGSAAPTAAMPCHGSCRPSTMLRQRERQATRRPQ